MTLAELAAREAIVSLLIIFSLLGGVFAVIAFIADSQKPMATYRKRR